MMTATAFRILSSIAAIRLMGRRIPLYCEWEITSHCNLRCRDCSTFVDRRNSREDIDTASALDIIGQLAALGTRMIHFSGGEPTQRSDLPLLLSAAARRGMIVSVTTNGTARHEILHGLLAAHIVRVSIDGTQRYHDEIRGKAGTFANALAAVKYLASKGARPQITVVYRPGTPQEMLSDLAKTARDIGVQMVLNVLGRNVNDNSPGSVLDPVRDKSDPRFAGYLEACRKLREEFGPAVASPEPIPTVIKKGGLDVLGCRALDCAISIKSDGSVCLPCTGLAMQRTTGRIRDVFYGRQAGQLRKQQGRFPLCKGCYIKCMCSASALLTWRGLYAVAQPYVRAAFWPSRAGQR